MQPNKTAAADVTDTSTCATRIDSEIEAPPLPPSTLEEAGPYRITGIVGSGGGGTVYLAVHDETNREAAVKVLRRDLVYDPRLVTRFAREIRAVNMIQHPNIVEVLEFGELPDGRPYYAMELVKGTDLRSLIEQQGRIAPDEVLPILGPVCKAVAAAHAAGVVHRDLKSRNIMVHRFEDQVCVKLLDFGIAKLTEPDPNEKGLTRAGTMLGTPVAMAPEQVRGELIDHRIDIYALGILLYQMLTGAFPFYSDHEPDLFRMHLEDPPPRPSASAPIALAYDAIVAKAMAKDREDRYATADDLLEAIRAAASATAPEREPPQSCRVVAVYLGVAASDDEDEQDEDFLDDLMNALDLGDEILREMSYEIPLSTSTAMLAVQQLAPDAELIDACSAAHEIAERLLDELNEREDPDERVKLQIAVHIGTGTKKNNAEGASISGGEILDLCTWVPQASIKADEVHLSAAMRNALEAD
ncbi:MAG: serine/threonine-protein kinase [Nannocystaceae bacterium]